MPLTEWRRSSFSGQGGTDCVQVAFAVTGVAVRDSKNATGPVLKLPLDTWHRLLHPSASPRSVRR